MLRSPVAERVPTPGDLLDGPAAGLTALASYTSIAEPGTPVIAVSAPTWRAIRNKLSDGRSVGRMPRWLRWRRGSTRRRRSEMAHWLILYHSSSRCGTPRMSAWKPRWLSSSQA